MNKSLILASHAIGSARKAIIGVVQTPMWSLGFPMAFLSMSKFGKPTSLRQQLNSGIGD